MDTIIISFLISSATMSVLALVLMAISPSLAKRYSTKWIYYTFTKKRIVLITFWIVMAFVMGTPFLLFPWFTFIVGRINSLLTMIIALGLLFGSIAWFVSSPQSLSKNTVRNRKV